MNALYLFWTIFTEVWLLLDICLNLRTGVCLQGSETDVDLRLDIIRKYYICFQRMGIDVISTIPADKVYTIICTVILNFFIPAHADIQGVKMMLSFKIFMPNTIQGKIFMLATTGLRLVRIVRYIKRVEESMKDNQTWKQVMIKLINQIMTMYLVAHVNACLNYLVSRQSENTQSWVYARGIQTSNQEIYTAYRWALFKSFSHMFCIGFGIVHPTTFHDALTTLFSMLSGSIMFVLFLGQMTSLFQSLNISKAQYKQKLQQVKEYMIFRKLPMELRYRMNDYYENRFQGKMFDEDKI